MSVKVPPRSIQNCQREEGVVVVISDSGHRQTVARIAGNGRSGPTPN
jgi:hypothetical protein